MDVYHSDSEAPYARLSDPSRNESPLFGFLKGQNVDILILLARQRGYNAQMDSDEWWPHDERKLYLDRAGQPLTKADRYLWQLHALLAEHKELIGYLGSGPVYCLQHGLERCVALRFPTSCSIMRRKAVASSRAISPWKSCCQIATTAAGVRLAPCCPRCPHHISPAACADLLPKNHRCVRLRQSHTAT